jgi:hypothetical protein
MNTGQFDKTIQQRIVMKEILAQTIAEMNGDAWRGAGSWFTHKGGLCPIPRGNALATDSAAGN